MVKEHISEWQYLSSVKKINLSFHYTVILVGSERDSPRSWIIVIPSVCVYIYIYINIWRVVFYPRTNHQPWQGFSSHCSSNVHLKVLAFESTDHCQGPWRSPSRQHHEPKETETMKIENTGICDFFVAGCIFYFLTQPGSSKSRWFFCCLQWIALCKEKLAGNHNLCPRNKGCSCKWSQPSLRMPWSIIKHGWMIFPAN